MPSNLSLILSIFIIIIIQRYPWPPIYTVNDPLFSKWPYKWKFLVFILYKRGQLTPFQKVKGKTCTMKPV